MLGLAKLSSKSIVIAIANNDLPSVEYTYEIRKREVEDLETEKRNPARIFQEINDKILSMRNRLDSINLDCEKELAQRDNLYQKRMKLEVGIRQFQNNNEEYARIRNTVEGKVHSILVDRKELLGHAVLCVIESMRKDPDKYGHLIYYSDDNDNAFSIPTTLPTSPIAAYYNRQYYYPSYTHEGGAQEQQQYCLTKDSFKQVYIDILKEESEKLFTSLEKILVDEYHSFSCVIILLFTNRE